MGQNMGEQNVRISVRSLVEFILREGDIDNRAGTGQDREAMQLGSKIHRKIQRQMGSGYVSEVSLRMEVPCEDFTITVEGRADGIIAEQEGVTIDEIKGVLCELKHIEHPVGVHLAQAKCYAYIYACQQDLDEISVQMTYCQMETEEMKRFREHYTRTELEGWFLDLVHAYEKWARFQIEWRKKRNASIRQLEFPFPYREGQRDVVHMVYHSIRKKKRLFIQAPTGIGKTMATVFPAVRAVGEELGEKVFYLTAKTITRTVAEQAFQTLKEQQLQYKVITLTAKEKICFCDETECNPEHCPYAKGHYDRINDAVYEMLTATSDMSRTRIEEQARKHMVCPFELSLDLAIWVDAVICDYNYVFDPNAHLRRFFSEGKKGDYLFLIDEAHNLIDRGREMYSASLYKEDFLAVKKAVRGLSPKLARKLDVCNRQLLELKRECEGYHEYESVGHLALNLMNAMTELSTFLEECGDQEVKKEVLDLYFRVREFLNVYDRLDENYVIYTEFEQDGKFKLKLFCVNPAKNLREFLDYGNSAVFFSATLLPIHYYKQLLSGEMEDDAIYVHSPFRDENRLLVQGVDVSTKYTLRGAKMYERYADYILRVAEAKKGNYLAFFPSYRFLEEVLAVFQEKMPEEMEYIVQSQYMNEEAREIFLETFEEERDHSLIGFCVMGGIFSEGIDLVEERLIGAFVVGTGLPQVCSEREILKHYFDGKSGRGFDYAYLYPGMNKVLQAAGRVIRTDTDRGVILLLDDRFRNSQYTEIFPREWSVREACTVENIEEKVRKFWE